MTDEPERTDERPIRIYGANPAGAERRGPIVALVFRGVFLLGLVTLFAVGALPRLAETFDALLRDLPWYRPELLPVGALLLVLLSLPFGVRLLRRRRAAQARAELYADRIILEHGLRRLVLAPNEIDSYVLGSPEFVTLQPSDRETPADLRQIPTPNDEVRALVVDWLDARHVRRLDA